MKSFSVCRYNCVSFIFLSPTFTKWHHFMHQKFADHLATSKDHSPLLAGLSSVTSGKCRDTTLKYTMKTFLLNIINCVFFVMFSAAFATNFATKERNIKRNKTKMRWTISLIQQYHYPHSSEPAQVRSRGGRIDVRLTFPYSD